MRRRHSYPISHPQVLGSLQTGGGTGETALMGLPPNVWGCWSHFTDRGTWRLGERHLSKADDEAELGPGAKPSRLVQQCSSADNTGLSRDELRKDSRIRHSLQQLRLASDPQY